ncbi:EAL domain, c-di-GMP-specific phosphodiesterase class I (or its enzymatically inactive variant) [Nakamurella panacisegetis]|uniref:EAL domain, c-di-GMP-specific phosphodiesterase class I (Or its enzymatically inactive variant) n=1 Tax=Nakamurella panacisegetis TaxID=1090615 RepID=A0A1H0T6V3_9ACTN|nr:EAL domain-containing protein [Nakamurella panacisegetis]SDP49595.1 EAL domain, c-di-GMP-specific phosphodiesterase class I (or its enzymatically inactive variant) [Nakamurella panacisegetis]
MTDGPELLRSRSARHYLKGAATSTRLQTTIALAARALSFPMAMINILDEDSQHTIGILGTDDKMATPREVALCDAVVRSGSALVVTDAGLDPRFAGFPVVTGRDVGTFIGVPLMGRESLIIGALCVIDPRPRDVADDQADRLVEFGSVVEDQLDLMRRLNEQRQVGSVLTQELAQAIRGGHIIPWYQPVVDLDSDRIVGVEALARWQHPEGEITNPARFIPLAEDSDLIIDLDLTIISLAARDVVRWHAERPDLRLSVNLSGRHFDRDDFLTPIASAVTDAGLSPEAVDLELTETKHLGERVTSGLVHQLRDAGFGVWLDDFGTGWSSLEYLLRMPVSGVKIDRALTLALGSRIGNALTTAVTGLTSELDLKTTIEGVETRRNAQIARDLGCDFGQGYFWSPPVPAPDLPRLWASSTNGSNTDPSRATAPNPTGTD